MSKKSVFISYDYDNDKHYKNLLVAWDKNDEFDFSMEDHSADVSINSHDADVIKRSISAKINRADYFLCIIGSSTHNSDWVTWEIKKAVDLDKKICAVKVDKSNISPDPLLRKDVNVSWAMSFTFNAIDKALSGSYESVASCW